MNLEEKVIEIVAENIESDHMVKIDSNLREDLEIDSLGVVILINALEDEFDIEIDDEAFKSIVSVKDMVTKLEKEYL